MFIHSKRTSLGIMLSLGVLTGGAVALAQSEQPGGEQIGGTAAEAAGAEELGAASEDVQEAVNVVQQMKQDQDLTDALSRAKGVFILPDYATASLIIGGSGGEGVLVEQQGSGQWSNPLFYDVGSISFGAQAGAAAGSIAMLLMTDEAVNGFRQENNFSLDAEAGLTIIDWSAATEANIGRGDVIMWSDVEGLLAEVALAVSDINFDEEETAEFYNQPVTPQAVLAGEVQVSEPQAEQLKSEFAALTTE